VNLPNSIQSPKFFGSTKVLLIEDRFDYRDSYRESLKVAPERIDEYINWLGERPEDLNGIGALPRVSNTCISLKDDLSDTSYLNEFRQFVKKVLS
jgi:hypothetical protein